MRRTLTPTLQVGYEQAQDPTEEEAAGVIQVETQMKAAAGASKTPGWLRNRQRLYRAPQAWAMSHS